MSVTPKGGGTGGQAVTDRADEPRTLGDRIRSGVRALLQRVPFARSLVAADDEQARESTVDMADDSVAPPDAGSVTGLPDRRRPFTYPTRNRSEQNTVELVGERNRETLTITHPENPEASITSDVWESVER